MATYATSRVFAAIEAAYLRLQAQAFTGTGTVDVLLGDTPASRLEFVRVDLAPASPVRYSPRSSNRVNEEFEVRIQIVTAARHRDGLTALQRLGELVGLVQWAFRDSTTGAPDWLTEVDGLGREVIVAQGAFVSLSPTVLPLDGGGFGGEAFLDLQLVCVV